jgi:hypothetical protein
MQETMEEVYNGLTMGRASGQMTHEKLAVVNHVLHTLAGIEENFRDTLEYISQEAVREFQISMSTDGKIFKELCARKNNIARSMWLAKTKAVVAETFLMDVD